MPATRLSARIIARLVQAEACELNPHLRDDLQIARLTVLYAWRGEAVLCSPHVLASYAVLGLHPDKVWPAIEERRESLGVNQQFAGGKLPPKKPPLPAALRSQEKLCPEKTNGARAANSRAGTTLLSDNTSSAPMTAAPSIIAGYRNSDAPSSVEKGAYSYDDLLVVIAASGAPEHVRQLTLDALAVRGRWPKAQGPVTPIISVSITSLQDKATVWRSTIQRRIQSAKKDKYWREVRSMNSWLDCPKCGAKRESRQCPKCPHKGNGFDAKEFRRTFTYAIDVQKFEQALPCRQVREIRELRARRSPKGVAATPAPKPGTVITATPVPQRQTAEHQKTQRVTTTEITDRAQAAANLIVDLCGLPDEGIRPYVMGAVVAEARFAGLSIDDAAKSISECVGRDQRAGVAITRFYFRDAKWRSNGGRQQQNASQQRTHANRQAALGGIYREVLNDFSGEPDGPPLALGESPGGGTVSDCRQREHEPERGKGI